MHSNKNMGRRKHTWIFYTLFLLSCGILLFLILPDSNQVFKKIPRFFNSPSVEFEFSGEPVPIENIEVRDYLYRHIYYHGKWHMQSLVFYKRSLKWFPVIEPILEKYDIPDDFKYLAIAESELTNSVSKRGAAGFWQFMVKTAPDFGLVINDEVDERFNIEKATEAACKYLAYAYKELNNWTLAAASYNIGVERLKAALFKQKKESFYDLVLNGQTTNYIYRIIAIKEVLTRPEKFGFNPLKKLNSRIIPTYAIKIDSSITDLAQFSACFRISLSQLKVLNPWILGSKLMLPEKVRYKIKLPKKGYEDLIEDAKTDTIILNDEELIPDSLPGSEKPAVDTLLHSLETDSSTQVISDQ